MAHPTPEQISDIILGKREVYGLDMDSRIRSASNRMSARALLELFARLDDESPDFAEQFAALLRDCDVGDPSILIGFDTGAMATIEGEEDLPEIPEHPFEYYLRLVFRDEEAAYYQFHLFPDMNAGYICGGARKREGAVQHVRVELVREDALELFIESCQSNPHLLRVERSTAEEFWEAPSHGV
jgi:hypothetical protein